MAPAAAVPPCGSRPSWTQQPPPGTPSGQRREGRRELCLGNGLSAQGRGRASLCPTRCPDTEGTEIRAGRSRLRSPQALNWVLADLAGTDESLFSLSLHSLTIKREATPLRSQWHRENQISEPHSITYVTAARFMPRVLSRGGSFVKQASRWVQDTWGPVFSCIRWGSACFPGQP